MKITIRYTAIGFLIAAIFFTSCKKKTGEAPELSVSPSEINLPAQGGTAAIAISANAPSFRKDCRLILFIQYVELYGIKLSVNLCQSLSGRSVPNSTLTYKSLANKSEVLKAPGLENPGGRF